ncbi:MAG: protein-disulfide reductase DsbD [Pseudomonadota bacterium]
MNLISRVFAALLTLALAFSAVASSDAPLRPADAFRYSLSEKDGELLVNWDLEPGYYLYAKKLAITAESSTLRLGEAILPEGEEHEDEYFGKQTVFRNQFTVRIPYSGGGLSRIDIVSQGCADLGICYPPQKWNKAIRLPAQVGSALDSPTSASVPKSASVFGGLGNAATGSTSDVPPAHEIFQPVATVVDGQTLEIAWQIAPAHYLYRKNVKVSSLNSDVTIQTPLELPTGVSKEDEYFGVTEVYFDALLFEADLAFADDTTLEFAIELEYQGCAEEGICYPPLKRYAEINIGRLDATVLPPDAPPPQRVGAPISAESVATGEASEADPVATTKPMESEQGRLARLIKDGNLALVLASFFGMGLLLSLTPCVLPMIPILSGIIAGEGEKITPMRGFMLSLVYVLGMALTYTIAGALFAVAGQQAQAVFQNPYVLASFAVLFVILAMSMFGMFELQMPSAIQSRLAAVSGKQKSGTYIGAFVMGALSSLIVTACVAPPLVAALAVIGQSGDVVRGGLALFFLSIGMGAPLLIVGASAGRLMPKAGPWMVAIKVSFGFLMLALAVYILSRILPGPIVLAAYGIIAVVASVFLGALDPLSRDTSPGPRIAKSFGLIGLLYGLILLLGALTGGHDPLRPVSFSALGSPGTEQHEGISFKRIDTVADLERELALASSKGQPIMLDLYADWCASCKELEKYTFSDATVAAALGSGLALQADLTANDENDLALMEHFELFGLPAIMFFDASGKELPEYRVVGMMHAEEFSQHLSAAFGT